MKKKYCVLAVAALAFAGLSATVGNEHLFNTSGKPMTASDNARAFSLGGSANGTESETDPIDLSAYEAISTYDGWASTNNGQANSSSSNEWELIVPTSDCYLTFDYSVSSEGNCDVFSVIINDGSNDYTLLEGSGESSSTYIYQIKNAGTYKLIASYRKDGSVDTGSDMGTISNIKLLVFNPIGKARDYLSALEGKTGLINELTAAIEKAEAVDDTLKTLEYRNLCEVLSNVKNANNAYAEMQSNIAEGDSLLTTGEFEGLAEVLDNARNLDIATAGSADYLYQYSCVSQAISISRASLVDVSDWKFGSNAINIDNMYYYIDNEHKLAQFRNPSDLEVTSASIPSTITYNGDIYTVVSIYNQYYWDRYFEKLKELYLPNTIRKIGAYAFSAYPNLAWVELPKNVELIEGAAFENANNLYWIKLNTQVPPTCTGALGGTSFKRLNIPNGSMHAYRLSQYLGNYNLITETPIDITVNVVDAGDFGRLVLEQAGYLQEVNKLTVTGEFNNEDWTSLKGMTNLVEVDLSGLVNTEIPSELFYGNWTVTKVSFPSGLKSIGNSAFREMGVEEIVLPEGLETIEDYAFYDCANVTNIELPSTLKTIGYMAFADLGLVKSLVIPNSVTTIMDYAFTNCTGLEELTLSDNLSIISRYAFANSNIKALNLPESVTEIQNRAFSNCKNLKDVYFNDGLKSIGANAFYDCDSLKQIEFNEGLQYILEDAFYSCDGLTEITLPSSLYGCTYRPFNSCSRLKKINARSVIPPATNGYCPLYNVDMNDVVLTVPVWSVQEYQLAEGWNQFNTVEASDFLPQNVTINKNFVFSLTQSFPEDYKPNINLVQTSNYFTDAWGYNDYQHGNLTISSQSKLNVNGFNFVSSPYTKYISDYGDYFGGWEYTSVNPTSLIVNGEMRAENVNMSMKLCNNRWQFVSFPFDVKVSEIVPAMSETQWVVREYSGKNRADGKLDSTWVNVNRESVLSAGKGYIMHCYNNYSSDIVDFYVTPYKESVNRQGMFVSEDKTTALEENIGEFEHNRSWNLIGNPYPSYYDTRFMGFESPITVWNSYTNSYYAYSPVDDSYILSPNESFFVQRPIDQENILFSKEGRQVHRHVRTIEQRAAARAYQVKAPRNVYNFILSDETLSDRTRVVINESAQLGYEVSCDASKFMSDNQEMPQLYSLNGDVRFAINERPLAGGEVAFGYRVPQDGTYTITLDTSVSGEVFIEDRETGIAVRLTSEGYSFNAKAGENTTRFVVCFGAPVSTGIDALDANATNKVSGVALDGKMTGESYKGIVVKNNRKYIKK